MKKLLAVCACVVLVWSCTPSSGDGVHRADGGTTSDSDAGSAGDTAADASDPMGLEGAFIGDDYGAYTLPGGGERYPCAQWTLHNDKPLYVRSVELFNGGGFHHSNWYALPDDKFEGDDGMFRCEDRGFNEIIGAVSGVVVFAQSTQARDEKEHFPEGVVIKIPPHYKIIGALHLLNVSTQELKTDARMRLGLEHPANVVTVATPIRLDNKELTIPAGSDQRFTASCDMAKAWRNRPGHPFDVKLYWLLPHYHGIGNYFRVDLVGGPNDGDTIYELDGFNAEANGTMFDPPIDLSDADGLRFTCGYHNPRDRTVRYGLSGSDEMCTMLAFLDSDFRVNGEVSEELSVDDVDGIPTHEGKCVLTLLNKLGDHDLPTDEEIDSPLYVPDSDDVNGDDLVPSCEDTPLGAVPTGPVTLTSIQQDVFLAGCTFSSCHGAQTPAAGLDLKSQGLRQRLVDHEMVTNTSLPLVDPGNAEGSWLYEVLSHCTPMANGTATSHMPRNSPELLDAGLVARVRDWIDDGAPDN